MGVTANDVLKVARAWLGYSESNGKHKDILEVYNSHKPLARGYTVKPTDEWCDTFVSAVAIKAGAVDLIGTECGCEKHVAIFKELGIWIEDGTITPKPGDIILFNWDDKTQANDGRSDHIGYVEKVSGNKIVTIEGNMNEKVARRTIDIGWGYIRGFARPKYDVEKVETKPESTPATNTTKSEVKATGVAKEFDENKAGTYTVTTALHLRNGAGTNNKSLVVIPKGTKVKCYGYYSIVGGVTWLSIQFRLNGVTYTGFSSAKYLKK